MGSGLVDLSAAVLALRRKRATMTNTRTSDRTESRFKDRITIWECDTILEHDHVEHGCKGATYLREGLFSEEHRLGDDGAGSYPPHPETDRPQSRWRRLAGPWERVT
jgi:hypothetical protein